MDTEHVADKQPYIHLFTVPLQVVKARVSNGGKFVDKAVNRTVTKSS